MQANLILMQIDDLRQVIAETVKELIEKHGLGEKPSSIDEGEWLTRDEVCELLHITYTTLWRKENEGAIRKHKLGRRNLYSKKEVMDILASSVETSNNTLGQGDGYGRRN